MAIDLSKLKSVQLASKKSEVDVDSLVDNLFAEDSTEQVAQEPIIKATSPAVPNIKEEVQPKEDGFWNTYLGDTIEKIGAGLNNYVSNTAGWMDKGARKINDLVGDTSGAHTSESGKPVSGAFGDISKSAKKVATGLRADSDRYKGKKFGELWKDDKAAAIGDIFLQASESLAPSMMAAFTGPLGVASLGASAANEKYDVLDESNPNMAEVPKMLNALLTGTAEAGSEYLGSVPVGKWLKGMYSKVGSEAAQAQLQKGLAGWIGNNAKKLGVFFPPVAEGTEEIASQVAENITDWATGARLDFNPMEGVLESFVYGAGGGAQFSAMSLPSYGMRVADKAKTGYDLRKATKSFDSLFQDENAANVVSGLNSMSTEEQASWLEAVSQSPDYSEEQKKAAADLLQSSLSYNARRSPEEYKADKENRDQLLIDTEMRNFDSYLSPMIAENGMIQQVKIGDEEVYITKGDISLTANEVGKPVFDPNNSSDQLYYTDKDGNIQVTSSKMVTEVLDIQDSKALREQHLQNVMYGLEQRNNQSSQMAQEVTIENGDPVQFLDPSTGKMVEGIAVDTALPDVIQMEDGRVIPREQVMPNLQSKDAVINPPADETKIDPILAQEDLVAEEEQAAPGSPVIDYLKDKEGNADYDNIADPLEYAAALTTEYPGEELDIINQDLEYANQELESAKNVKSAIESRKKMKAAQDKIDRLNSFKAVFDTNNKVADPLEQVDPLEDDQESIQDIDLSQLSEPERRVHISQNSNDPLELADLYEQVKDEFEVSQMMPWEAALVGRKISKDSFIENSDKNNVTGAIAKSWFADKDHARKAGLDVIAAELSEYGTPVTENDIVEFVLSHPNNNVKKTNHVAIETNRRFKEVVKALTGENVGGLESTSGKLVLAGLKAGVRSEQEKQSQPFNSYTVPDAVLNFFEETGLNPDDFDSFEALNDAISIELEKGTFVFPLGESDLQTINNIVQHGIRQQGNYQDFASRVEKAGAQRTAQQPIFETAAAETAIQPITGATDTATDTGGIELQPEIIPEEFQEQEQEQPEELEYTPEEMAEIDAAVSDNRPLMDVIKEVAQSHEITQAEKQVNIDPTEAQKEAGNYKMGHVSVNGFDITIENPRGSTRSGVDADGKTWSIDMANSYGYIKGTKGKDGDHVDVFMGDSPLSDKVFVIDQINKDGSFDEHKVMMGFNSIEEAQAAYLANYEQGWTGLGSIIEMPVDEFRTWVKDGVKSNPVVEVVEEQAKQPVPTVMEEAREAARNLDAEDSKNKPSDQTPIDNNIQPISSEEALGVRGETNKAKSVKSKAAPSNDVSVQAEKIEDFGEKIGGAKKDLVKEYRDRMGRVTEDDVLELPLSKSFPRPDFKKLVEEGMITENQAIYMSYLYDKIESKPRQANKAGRWASRVHDVITMFNETVDGKSSPNLMEDAINKMRGYNPVVELEMTAYRDIMKKMGFPNNPVTLGQYSITQLWNGSWFYLMKGKHVVKKSQDYKEIVNMLAELLEQPKAKKEVRLSIYRSRKSGLYYIGKSIPGKDPVKLSKDFNEQKEVVQYLKDNNAELVQLWEKMNVNPEERRESNRTRKGTDWRGKKDVTPELFGNTFGFRGVEFGNWVNKSERQSALNDAYDALMDLSSIIGVSPKALSLGGGLSLAFGARGGSKASAHYEPSKVVINLTKTKGAGSLAHEWFHALDNYFSKRRGENGEFMTKNANKRNNDTTRQELLNAFEDLVATIYKSDMRRRSNKLDTTRSKAYWGQNVEMAARAFESYVIDKLNSRNEQNDYLANVKSMNEWSEGGAFDISSYPYPNETESPVIGEKFDQLFQTIEEKEDEDGNQILFRDGTSETEQIKEDTVNEQFNKELQQQIGGTLPEGHVYKLGMPSEALLSAGIPSFPIELKSERLGYKSTSGKHDYDISEVVGLPNAIANPIAIFKYGDEKKAQNIITELEHNGEKFLVGISITPKIKGHVLEINSVRNVFPKNSESIVDWINGGKMLYSNKEKLLSFLDQQRTNHADVAFVFPNESVKQGYPEALLSATNIVNSFENPTLEQGNILSEIETLSTLLNTPVRIVRDVNEISDKDRDIEKRMRKSRGWYDTRTGEVVVVLQNNKSVADAQKTILHEVVGHLGLRKLLGSEFAPTMESIFDSLPKDLQFALKQKYGSKVVGAEEYASTMAETMSDPGIIQRIVSAFKDAMRKIGFNLKMTDGDIMNLLWKSKNRLTDGDTAFEIMGKMSKAESVKKETESFDRVFRDSATLNDTMDEMSDDPVIKAEMHASIKSKSFQWQEGYQDRMLAVKKLQELLEKHTGKKLPDHMNVYIFENTLSSRNTYEIEQYKELYTNKMMENVKAFISKGYSMPEVENYVIAKHGLERNDYFRINALLDEINALEKNDAYLEWLPDAIRSNSEKFQARVAKDKAALLEEIGTRKFSEIEGLSMFPIEKTRQKLAKRDFAGITALEKELEMSAQEYIDITEGRFENETKELWKSINAATKASLKKWFDSGMINKEVYNKINGMYEYYVPLRGFAEDTAADVYEYFTEQVSPFNNPLKKAFGRISKPETPFAHIVSAAGSSIVGGNKNIMKLHLLRLAQNNPSDYMTVNKAWYVDNGQIDPETNKPIYDAVFPEYSENMDEYRANVEEFEAEMEELKAQGIAFKGTKKLKPGYKISKVETSEHMVRAMLNGEEHFILVHGDPRVAQAINGLNDTGRQESKFMKTVAWMNRQMAANYTTRNPAFIATNTVRDVVFASTALSVKEGAKYTLRFEKNVFAGHAGGALGRFLKGKPDYSREADVFLKEFLENGGETGYTALYNIEKYKKMIERETKQGKVASTRRGYMTAIDFFANSARWAEDLSRFSVYMTSRQSGRSILKSVNDAKEVTVNFNRKGSGSHGAGFARGAYLFFNAAIQSLSNAATLIKKNPVRASAAMFGYAAAGSLIPIILSSLGDDDDLERYNNLPDYVRKNHLCIPMGEGFIKISLPIELRAFYGLGDQLHRMYTGADSMGESLVNIGLSFMDLLPLNPAGGGDAFENILPDAFAPLWQSYSSNKDFTGKPIANITPFNEFDPEYLRVYKSANQVPVYVSQILNSVTGGDEVKRGGYDKVLGRFANPASFEHLFESYFGGLWTTINHTYKTAENGILAAKDAATGDDSFDWSENQGWRTFPILNRFVDEGKFNGAMSKINDRYFKAVKEMKETKYLIRGYEEKLDGNLSVIEAMKVSSKIAELESGKIGERMYLIEDYTKDIESLNKESQDVPKEKRSEIVETMNDLKSRMLEKLKEIDNRN